MWLTKYSYSWLYFYLLVVPLKIDEVLWETQFILRRSSLVFAGACWLVNWRAFTGLRHWFTVLLTATSWFFYIRKLIFLRSWIGWWLEIQILSYSFTLGFLRELLLPSRASSRISGALMFHEVFFKVISAILLLAVVSIPVVPPRIFIMVLLVAISVRAPVSFTYRLITSQLSYNQITIVYDYDTVHCYCTQGYEYSFEWIPLIKLV